MQRHYFPSLVDYDKYWMSGRKTHPLLSLLGPWKHMSVPIEWWEPMFVPSFRPASAASFKLKNIRLPRMHSSVGFPTLAMKLDTEAIDVAPMLFTISKTELIITLRKTSAYYRIRLHGTYTAKYKIWSVMRTLMSFEPWNVLRRQYCEPLTMAKTRSSRPYARGRLLNVASIEKHMFLRCESTWRTNQLQEGA